MFEILGNHLYNLVDDGITSEFRFDNLPDYGFDWVGYDGTQANNPRNTHQGAFDILIVTGPRFTGNISHRDILSAILEEDLLYESRQVWEGANPMDIGESFEHQEILTALMLLMFEQEVNWGRPEVCFQRHSPYYKPFKRSSMLQERRPRDMIMAYIEWSFEIGNIEDLCFWLERTGRTTLSPKDPSDRNATLHPVLDEYREMHRSYEIDALMVGYNLQRFTDLAHRLGRNPEY